MKKKITKSVWSGTKTFFPLFVDYLENNCTEDIIICILGASDGRYVIPLADKGYNIRAIESDDILINGGNVEGPNDTNIKILGLKKNLFIESLQEKVEIINENFYDLEIEKKVDVIFTSSTWDCRINHSRPVKQYIEKMQNMVKKKGVFCAEYMMPCENIHNNIEHFLGEKEINKFFDNKEWEILEEFYTPVFDDKPHIGKIIPHKHRMGFFMAKRIS